MDTGPEIAVVDASSSESLVEALAARSPTGRFLVADLSMGGWRPHELLRQALEQIGEPPTTAMAGEVQTPSFNRLSWARLIGTGIDLEARGEAAVLAAHRYAAAVDAGARRLGAAGLLVLAPGLGAVWEREDRLAVEALAPMLRARGRELLLGITGGTAPLPVNWVVELPDLDKKAPSPQVDDALALLPSTLGPSVAEQLDLEALDPQVLTLPLPGEVRLIAPECRRPPADVPAAAYERLMAVSHGWLRAYAQQRARNIFVESALLAEIAWSHFQDGGAAIALRLLERAIACAADSRTRTGLEIQAQGIRIASGRFAEAAASAKPSPGAPAAARRLQLETIGWGLAMSARGEDAARGKALLEEAAELLEPTGDPREDLYLRNILALATLKSGDANGALVIEESIRGAVGELAEPDFRLVCINELNLARLQRRLGKLDRAEEHYRRAFATSAGVRPPPEAVYANATLARLAEDRGDQVEARIRWLRAALHWLALELPEAFPRRFAAVLGPPGDADPGTRASAVAAGLLTRLNETSPGSHSWRGPLPTFRGPGASTALVQAVGAPGWGVLLSGAKAGRQPCRANRDLARMVLGLLVGEDPNADWERAATVVVDPRHGCELPVTRLELLDAALEHDASTVRWQGREVPLDRQRREELGRHRRVLLGPAVVGPDREGDSIVVGFRRQRPTIRLHGRQASAVATVRRQESLPLRDLVEANGVPPGAIAELRHRRILTLKIGEDACTLAGI
jgi:tetratricopeptide (TPR) repeat protein